MKRPTYAELKAAISTLANGLTATPPKTRARFFRYLLQVDESPGGMGVLDLCDAYEDSLDDTLFSTLPWEVGVPALPPKKTRKKGNK